MNEPLWQLLIPCHAATFRLPIFGTDHRRLAARVRRLPKATSVVLLDPAPFSSLRCRRFAAMADVELERHYLALPALGSALYLVEDAPESIRYFESNILTIPPTGGLLSALLGVLLALATRLLPWRMLGALAMGGVALGRRR